MNEETLRLEELKKKMTPAQRKEMSDLIENELRARQAAGSQAATKSAQPKSAVPSSRLGRSLPPEQVSEIYQDVGRKMQQSRVQELEHELKRRKRKEMLMSLLKPNVSKLSLSSSMFSGKTTLLLGAISLLALSKILISTGVIATASINRSDLAVDNHQVKLLAANVDNIDSATPLRTVETPPIPPGMTTPIDRQLLTELDDRRVELERRREALDERELGLKRQEDEIATRLAELKSLTLKVSEYRKERDHQQEARLEQLANVYGSMAPNEASAIIARLDETISLPLLERLPEKRLGQILSSMDQQRAIEMTKKLTERRSGD